jgi:hypothetical protein
MSRGINTSQGIHVRKKRYGARALSICVAGSTLIVPSADADASTDSDGEK